LQSPETPRPDENGGGDLNLSISAFHARGAALSPDGRWLYTFGGFDESSTVRVFARNARSGLLMPIAGPRGCARLYWAAVKCTPMHVNKPTSAAISPDGRELFLTGYCCARSFAAFRRDPRTGALVKAVCCDAEPRAVVRGYDLAVSPDGRNVYVASATDTGHGLAILDRDPATDALIQPAGEAGCIQRIGANRCARGAGRVVCAFTGRRLG
jgi:DNA-binding beta-propeller fold protein YncE